jgi:hypothetical protein
MQAIIAATSSAPLGATSRPCSARSQRPCSARSQRLSLEESEDSGTSSGISHHIGHDRQDYDDDDDWVAAAASGRDLELLKRSHQLYQHVANISEELNIKCWKCISDHTDLVIASDAFIHQPLEIVQSILKLDIVNIPEVALLRAVIQWADNKCKLHGLLPLHEHRRQVLGDVTIELLRFPSMTSEQIQWEVVPSGLLDFKDIEILLTGISGRNMLVGRFNGQPRQYPISSFLNHQQKLFGKSSLQDGNRAKLMEIYVERAESLANDLFSTDGTDGKLAPKPAPYIHRRDDEIDAVLGLHLLRARCDRFVDELGNDTSASDAIGSTVEVRVTRALDPWADVGLSTSAKAQHINKPHQPHSCGTASMLMHSSWLDGGSGNDGDEDAVNDYNDAVSAVEGLKENAWLGREAAGKYTEWGCVPEPQDFRRMARGFYSFRDEHVLEMRLENGEHMVYEHGVDDWEDDHFRDNMKALVTCDNPEMIRRELDLDVDWLPDDKVPLDVFLCRQ